MSEQSATPKKQAKASKERRTIRKITRWLPSEFAAVNSLAEAHNVDWSEWIRAAALKKKPKPRTQATGQRLDLIQIMGAINKVGSNTNQIAKRLNMQNPVEQAALVRALDAVTKCAEAIRQQVQSLGHDR